ncbi:hypothetical protein B0T10DRAFT_463445 [Thelonectria olida]|uniref:Uncharacterized protein n=1 Tax=Thelonectria olida TaxID=1576542 RepID=A0A9P9AKT2_9HYPO|nr:hypothetical protein B0T10DRAFT_463445 [Thelonectria olida]
MFSSYIAFGDLEHYESIWSTLFHDMTFLDLCQKRGIYFTIIGEIEPGINSYLALLVTNNSKSKFTRQAWNRFLNSLKKPYSFEEGTFEIKLKESQVTLNVYNFLYTTIHPDVVCAKPDELIYEYYKSGTIPMRNITASTYGKLPERTHSGPEITCPGPIDKVYDLYYRVELQIAGRKRYFKIASSLLDFWI